MDLFSSFSEEQRQKEAPLAARMRPRSLDEFIGDISTAEALDNLRDSSFVGRGQLGMYWSSLLAG